MSQVIDNLCEDSGGDNGERPNTASVHPFQFPERDREIRRNLRMAPVKTAKGSAKFVVDPTADEVEISPHGKRLVVTPK
jgi:hypothetical protein